MRTPFTAILGVCLLPFAAVRAEDSPKTAALGLLKAIDEGFVAVFDQVAPAVVVIEASKQPDAEERESIKGFEFFMEGEGKGTAKENRKETPPQTWRLPGSPARSEGSGFVIRQDGYILTNNHVVADAEKLEIRLRDGRKLPAKIVGADDKTDIAVLRVEAKDLPAVELGDSDALRVGQLVCAIGTPFNQDYSFTVGWVSGKGRSNLLGPSSTTILYEDYIQTDAFINPGNSGGPLFDVEGKVVGMNTLINGLGRGLAFAIPASMLRDVSQQLIASGKVQRPWLGIRIETLGENAALKERLAGVEKGVVVDTIEANAPAYRSDLRPADVITEEDGVKVGAARDLQREVLKKRVGQTLQLTVWRNGSTLKIPVATGELPAEITKVANPSPSRSTESKFEAFGLKLRDAKPSGAQVSGIVAESPASRCPILADDIITEVETKPVADAAACATALTAADTARGEKGVLLNIDRRGKRSFVVLGATK